MPPTRLDTVVARIVLAVALASPLVAVDAQGPATQPPASAARFEVASIKRNTTGIPGPGARSVGVQPGGRFLMVDGSALVLVRTAFPEAVDVVGAPDWALREHFDVQATAQRELTNQEMTAAVRALLEERFAFAGHADVREEDVYALLVARSDGRPAAGLRRYDVDCETQIAAMRDRGEKPALPAPASGGFPCGYSLGGGKVVSGGISLDRLAASFGTSLGRRVIDKTGLTGYYEFTLETSADVTAFTALREQLGLKLEPDRQPLPVVVVDRLERPTEN